MAPPLSNEVYLRNIAALWRVDARLAYAIDDWGEPRNVQVETARNGLPTAAIVDDKGRRLYLHSRYDPAAEAERLACSVPIEGHHCLVISGMGLGYHVKALHERTQGEACLLVFEPNMDVLAAALFTVDLSDVLGSGRCVILTRLDKDYLHRHFEPHGTLMMLGMHFVSHPASEQVAGAFHRAARAAVTDYISYAKMGLVTLVANSRITCRNVANNLPTYLSTPPINVLRNRFADLPAVIVSAGPSIGRNIEQLIRLQDRAVLIAVQTMLKPLLRRGVRPHFVTSLDFHEISKSFFEGLEPEAVADTHLVAEPKATWHVIDAYPGMISLLDNAFARLCVGDELAARDGLKAGATVAHLSYYLAEYMGCNPIIFVGQDLAYSDNAFYTPGVAIHDTWRPELNRFNTIEMKEWERIVRHRSILRKVKDIHGHEIYTDDALFTYLQQFESDFARSRSRIIDATEGGVRKTGAAAMPLAEAADRFCAAPLPAECFDYRRQVTWRDDHRLRPGREAIVRRIDQVRCMRKQSAECLAVLRELVTLTDRPEAFNRKLARVDDLRAQIERQPDVYEMVSMMAQHAELRRFSADRRIEAQALEGAEKARRQLARDIEFVESMIEAADALLDVLEETRHRFDRALGNAVLRPLPSDVSRRDPRQAQPNDRSDAK